jgi:hypothetical protein
MSLKLMLGRRRHNSWSRILKKGEKNMAESSRISKLSIQVFKREVCGKN